MIETEQLTLTLPKDVVDTIRHSVSSGEFHNESAYVEAAIRDGNEDYFSDEWIRREVLPVLDAMDADPSRALTPEQVRLNLLARHENLSRNH